MEILAIDFHGSTSQEPSVWGTVGDVVASRMRAASFLFNQDDVEMVQMDGVSSFVDRVLGASGGRKVQRLYTMDHGYTVGGAKYRMSHGGQFGKGPEWNKIIVEFGSVGVSHDNFNAYKPTLAQLAKVLGPGSQVIFLNCSVGNDAALLCRFANLWQCAVTGSTVLQRGLEIQNLFRGKWVTGRPGGKVSSSLDHPVWER